MLFHNLHMTKFTSQKGANEDRKGLEMETKFMTEGRWEPAVEVDNEAFKEFRKKHGLK